MTSVDRSIDRAGFGAHPVYCQTGPERCGVDMFLGYRPLNTPIRCPRCGRWSQAVRVGVDIKTVPK